MMNSIIFMWITIIVNILGWFILHILSKRRDLSNKKKEITIQYLITAWQLLENASNRNDNRGMLMLKKLLRTFNYSEPQHKYN